MGGVKPVFILGLLILLICACGSQPMEMEVPQPDPTDTLQSDLIDDVTRKIEGEVPQPDPTDTLQSDLNDDITREIEGEATEDSNAEGASAGVDELTCQNDLQVLMEPTLPGGTELPPGEAIRINWKVLNSGSCSWNEEYMLRFAGGEVMSPVTAVSLGQIVDPEEEATLSVSVITPDEPGDYHSSWQLVNSYGEAFGQLLEVAIVIIEAMPEEAQEPNIAPSQTAAPTTESCLQPSFVTAENDANIRGGPGTHYHVVGSLRKGETAEVNGRAGTWWRIEMPTLAGMQHWIAGSVVSFDGDQTCVPQAPVPSAPIPPDTPVPMPTTTPPTLLPEDMPTLIPTVMPPTLLPEDPPTPMPTTTPTLMPEDTPVPTATQRPTLMPEDTPVPTPTGTPRP